MKVLWFSNTPALGADHINLKVPGGGWLKSLDQALQSKVELHIAFHYPKPFMPFKLGQTHYYPITPVNWRLEMLKNILTNIVYDQEYKEKYLQLIDEIKPDIIHIHGTENSFGCIIGKTNVPVVVSIQGNVTVYFHKYLSGFSQRFMKTRNLKLSKGVKSFFASKNFASDYKRFRKMAIIEAQNLRNCPFIIGRTDWDRRITSVLAPEAIYYHGDEILRDGFYRNIWSERNSSSLIIHSTSGNNFYKGFETICQALYELNKKGVKVGWQVAGISESDLIVKVVRKKLGKIYPDKGLRLLGHLGENDLIQRMLEADVFVMASHIENSSNNLCEAMIMGMPCIATYAGGTGSLLKDGEEGILVQDGDPWVLAGAIIELLGNKERAVKFGAASRFRAVQRHCKAIIISDLITIYEKIIIGHDISNHK